MTDVTLGELVVLLALAVGWTVTVTAWAPRLLSLGTWWHRWPHVAIALWWATLVSVLASATVAALAGCLALVIVIVNVDSVAAKIVLQLVLATIVVAGIALASYVIGRSERMVLSHRAVRRQLATLIATHGTRIEERTGYELVVLDTEAPLALSVAGRPPRIVLSQGLLDGLSTDEVNAVIWHERGHLEFRHDSVVRLAALVAQLVPWVPASGRLARAVHLLTELAADDVASTHAGVEHVASAMDRLREAEGNAGATHRD